MDSEQHSLTAAGLQLLDALADLSDSVSFCASGTAPLVLPGLVVDGVDEVGLPISAKDARRLVKQASQAPYGRGEETIVDTDVRCVWQLEPSQFKLKNPKYDDEDVEDGNDEDAEVEDSTETWDNDAPGFKKSCRVSEKPPSATLSQAPLEFKGADHARADVMGQVAARANCRAFVALLTHWQSGYPDYGTIDYAPHGSRWGDSYSEDVTNQNERAEFEEVFDATMSLKHWHSLTGEPQPFDELSMDESDIVSDVPNEDRPYRQRLHEATGNAGVVEPLVRGFCAVGSQKELQQLLLQVSSKPQLYDLHQVVFPAVTRLLSDQVFARSSHLARSAVQELRQLCIDQLQHRTASKPEPPKNWKRGAKVDCDCADCQELAKFLKDKDAQVHRFPRRKELRQHLHRQIDHHRLDCAHVTERRGRPYTLVCSKNQASFERNLKQYETDCQLLRELSDG